jgi:hypothetical protein
MKESYIEGVAIHDGPESCVGVREGAGEVWAGVRAGWGIEPRNHFFGVPTSYPLAEGNIAGCAIRELLADPARSKNLCMHAISPCARTGRSRGRPCRVDGPVRAARGRLRP